MIIKKIIIENFLCYYDTNTFELSEGLNIILGENGEGKTKFFEAVDWLFNGENRELERLVSAKKLEETEIGNTFQIKISMTVDQFGNKGIITKSFVSKKIKSNECVATGFMIEGIEENNLGERIQIDGGTLLNRIFPFQIRKYSMFKGEAELNIFENESALENLINLFSEAKHYDKYAEKVAVFRENAEKAVEKSSKRDKENESRYKKLENEIRELTIERGKYQEYLNSTEAEVSKIEQNLSLAESHVDNADALEIINKRIRSLLEKISNVTGMIQEDYTTFLFDDNWILINFEAFHKEFCSKVNAHSKKRRELQSEFDRQKGIREGEKKAKADLLNNTVPLPNGVPSKSHMEEMLSDEICKVCNRVAKKGSKPYEFMMKRLEIYLGSQAIENDEPDNDEPLFMFDYTNRLEHLCISHEDNLKICD